MASLMRAHDWASTTLGEPGHWPAPLRLVVRLLLNTRHPMFVFWAPAHVCFYNDAYRVSIGPERHPGALGSPGREVWAEIWEAIGPQTDFVLSGRGAAWNENQLIPITRHGRRENVWWTYGYSPIDDEESATGVGGVLVTCTETTARVLAARLRQDQAEAHAAERDWLARLFEQAPSFMAMLNGPEHRIELANQAYVRLIGQNDVVGKTVAQVIPDAAEQGYIALLDTVFHGGEPFSSSGARFMVRYPQDGVVREHFLDFIYQPIKNEAGEVTGIFIEGVDVTARTTAEAALRTLNDTLEQRVAAEIAARAKMEEALHQAQKMEAVGQLTGGIAHDFNNMLQGVTGGIALARRRFAAGRNEEAFKFLDSAVESADRAAALTRRLLAFGRRQPLNPKPVRMDTLIRGMEDLIRRTAGPAITVALQMEDDDWPVYCDANQMESVLLNLAINARDAMPSGGKLSIETAHVTLREVDTRDWEAAPGDYVRVTVADTGTGMTPDVLAHVFEPFFTTKPDGQGTGLGLSQVYGFARQSRGLIRLDSEEGLGTEAHLYLPRCADTIIAHDDPSLPGASPPASIAENQTATVLLVEDEPAVRIFVAESLRELGFRVMEAEDGPSGLDTLHRALRDPQRAGVALLVTDVGLPGGLNGRQLADAARELVSGLPVLLITGYAGEAIKGQGQPAPGMEILSKPFDLEALVGRVRTMVKGKE